jgi:predicted metalloprotease
MQWDENHDSPDLIDRRGEGSGGGSALGLIGLFGLLRSPFGWIILLGLGAWFGLTRLGLLGEAPRPTGHPAGGHAVVGSESKETHFVSFVLDDVQSTWARTFAAQNRPYPHAKLVLFDRSTPTGCGFGQAATGPFYCPTDERVYLDLSFYHELTQHLGVKGQFAEAYVIAHEIGHHVQNLLGISAQARGTHRATPGAGGASVRLELQADCFAGIWAHSTGQRALLESGDIASALRAAAAIGDDRLQRMETGTVSPEKWTHGSSEQRVHWFRRGYDSGQMSSCDTFTAEVSE